MVYLRAAGGGRRPDRFNELKRSVVGVTQKMLGQTLRRLEHNGLVERRAYAAVPMRVEHEATAPGRTLALVIKDYRGCPKLP